MTAKQFNFASVEWEMKWAHVEAQQGVYTYALADSVVAYIEKHKMRQRGHCLVWHEEVPAWVNNLDKAALKKAIETRIR